VHGPYGCASSTSHPTSHHPKCAIKSEVCASETRFAHFSFLINLLIRLKKNKGRSESFLRLDNIYVMEFYDL
jgi:hypothetical protein